MTDHRRGRHEDVRFTSGHGRYTADLNVPGMLHAVFVRSPFANARLVSLDADAAREMPGVAAILTPEDLKADGALPFVAPMKLAGPDGHEWTQTPRELLVSDRARFTGEPVAMVLAETHAQALDAADAVEADYADAPAITDLAEAEREDAPLVHETRPGNVAWRWRKNDWDAVGEALEASARVTRLTARITRVAAVTMEPRAALAVPGERTTLHASLQNAPAMRGALSKALGVPSEEIRVIAPDVGGSFGMKSGPLREEILTFWAARRLNRPVKWVADRQEAMLTDEPGRDMRAEVELGLDDDARFTALRVRVTVNVGAYASARSLVAVMNFGGVSGVYDIPATAGEAVGLFTHTTPTAPYRGAGRPEATFAIERAIDEAAREIGLDPVELRRRNLVPASAMPWDTRFIFTYDSGDFAAVMDRAAERADLAGFPARREASRAKGLLRGLGVANCIEVAGGPFANPGADYAQVDVGTDGRIRLAAGAMSAGQGIGTAMVGLAAVQLGLPEDLFDYVQGDTGIMAEGKGMGGSAAMTTCAPAVQESLRKMLEKAKALAADQLEVSEADLEYHAGEIRIAGTDRALPLAEIARIAEAKAEALSAQGEFKPEAATYPNGCHICEVEVDPETGRTDIVSYAAVEDIGTVLYPQMAEGQIHGGVAQGLGQVLMEQVRYGEGDGQLLSATFMDYAMPRADRLPDYSCGFSEGAPTKLNPLGVKGVGEAGTVGALAAGVNAVCDALAQAGVRGFDMPATPQRVWAALAAARP